jgi:hypothetical protein
MVFPKCISPLENQSGTLFINRMLAKCIIREQKELKPAFIAVRSDECYMDQI